MVAVVDMRLLEVYIFVGTQLALVCVHLTTRLVSYNSAAFRRLTVVKQNDWVCRLVNLQFQVAQLIFNLYIIFLDPAVAEDYIYSYSDVFQIGACVITAFYLYDCLAMVILEVSSNRSLWMFHHVVTIALLLFNFTYRSGAFPAACFLISSAAHIANELRWFTYVFETKNISLLNGLHVVTLVHIFLSQQCAPFYMLYRIGRQRQLGIGEAVAQLMRWQCVFGCLLIFVPHCILLAVHVRKAWHGWGKSRAPPERWLEKKQI